MKIGNSRIYFNLSVNRSFKSMDEVPYWTLYAMKGDCTYPGWKSLKALTYNEIIAYLQNFKGHRVLMAYPRKSTNTRRVYAHDYNNDAHEFIIYDKHTGEVLYIVDSVTQQTKYLSSDYKKAQQFKKHFFAHGEHTYLATSLISKNYK